MPQRIGETIPASEFSKLKIPKVGDTISAEEFSQMQGGGASQPKPAPASGVNDPMRDLPATGAYGNPFGGVSGQSIKDRTAALLSPFSARSGTGDWQVPPIISGIGQGVELLGELLAPISIGNQQPFNESTSGFPKTREAIGSVVQGVTEGPLNLPSSASHLINTGDFTPFGEAVDQTVTQTLPAIYGGVKGAKAGVKGIKDARNLGRGRTSLDELGGIRPPIQPTMVEVGVAPTLTGTELLQYHPSVQLLAEGLGGKSNLLKMNRLQQSFNEALPDLKAAQSTTIRTAIDSPEKLRLVANTARNRVWNESIAPAIIGEVDLDPIGQAMLKSIPDSIRIQKPKEYLAKVKDINSRFIGKKATAKQVHVFAKEARAKIRSALAQNDFDMAAALETPDGKMAAAYNDTLRDVLWRHVETQTGRDIRPQLQRYGALSDIEQSALKSTVPPTIAERLFGSFVPPTQSGLKGRIGASAFGHWIDDYSKVRRAFDQYQLEPQKVTQPFNARYAPPQRQIGAVAGGARPMPYGEGPNPALPRQTPLPRSPRPGDRFLRDDGVELVYSSKRGWTPRVEGGISMTGFKGKSVVPPMPKLDPPMIDPITNRPIPKYQP